MVTWLVYNTCLPYTSRTAFALKNAIEPLQRRFDLVALMALGEGMDRCAAVSRTVPVFFCDTLLVVLRNKLSGTRK